MTRREKRGDRHIAGGYVHPVKNPGIHNWICVLDFKSMYPSIIIDRNLCFSTLSPDGEIDCIVNVPVKGVTNCTFGGLKLETLFITTSSWGMKRNEILKYTLAGNLFSVETGIKGLPDERFNG